MRSPRQKSRTPLPGWTFAASLVVHGAIATGIGWAAFGSLGDDRAKGAGEVAPAETAIVLDLPPISEGALLDDERRDPVGVVPVAAGGDTVPRIDTGAPGRGGSGAARAAAIHLDDRDEEVRLSPDLLSRLDRDQQQRLRTAQDRASWEDRRATTNPMELTFLATGTGARLERRPLADIDPSRGALSARAAAIAGGNPGASERPRGDDASRTDVGAAAQGARAASPGTGVDDGKPLADHRVAADVARGRPSVTEATVTVPATAHARPRDNVDSEQEVATTVQALVHASTAGGAIGEGNGGTGGGGAPGAGGGLVPGSHPRPLGTGEGDWFDLNSTDPRLVGYFRKIHAKVDPLWADAFPRSAMLDLKQGTVILEVTIERDGRARVAWPPIRPSGIDEFDRNCAAALRKASPFEPIPRELGMQTLRIRAPFVASNPIVR